MSSVFSVAYVQRRASVVAGKDTVVAFRARRTMLLLTVLLVSKLSIPTNGKNCHFNKVRDTI